MVLQEYMNTLNNYKIIKIYGNSKYSTIRCQNKLYIISTLDFIESNIIAIISINEQCTIVNRDKLNIFIDELLKIKNGTNFSLCQEDKIVQYLLFIVKDDLNSLITFKNNEEQNHLLTELINKFPGDLQIKINKGLNNLNILTNQATYTVVTTISQINYLRKKKLYYTVLDIKNQKYEMTNSYFTKVFKNGYVGTWEQLLQNEKAYIIFFDRTDDTTIYFDDLQIQINLDLQLSPYEVANRFIKLEDRISKMVELAIELITQKQGFVNLSELYYPNLEDLIEKLTKTLSECKKSDKTSKEALIQNLKILYSAIYTELQKSQDFLRKIDYKEST